MRKLNTRKLISVWVRRFGANAAGLAMLMSFALPALAQPADLLEQLHQPGHVVLMRHSLAPGSGDPSNFVLEDCGTQRNLDDVGRAQAASTGDAFRAAGLEISAVYSGRWCRNLETARLLQLGDVMEAPAFDSQMNLGSSVEVAARAFLADLPRDADTVFIVSHSSNIRGLTGVSVTSGEKLVLRLMPDGGFEVLGSLGVM